MLRKKILRSLSSRLFQAIFMVQTTENPRRFDALTGRTLVPVNPGQLFTGGQFGTPTENVRSATTGGISSVFPITALLHDNRQ